MNISEYIKILKDCGLLVKTDIQSADIDISGLCFDSRKAKSGSLFICKGKGFKPEFLASAIKSGAAVYVSELQYDQKNFILVKDVRKAMAVLANKFYDEPWKKIKLVGITGTKGKSTSLYFLKNIMEHSAVCGKDKFGYISTIETYDGKEKFESHLTTPEAPEFIERLSRMVDADLYAAAAEVSSQALKYDRCLGIGFDIACFTNFGIDHIGENEHDDIEDYFQSKLKIFKQCRVAVINIDSDRSREILEAAENCPNIERIITYSCSEKEADYQCERLRKEHGQIIFYLSCIGEIRLNIPGMFNAENAVCAAIVAKLLGSSNKEIISGLLNAKASGRMEVFTDHDRDLVVISDFAHNAMSFEAIFSSVKHEYPGYRIEAVFGAPGNKAMLRREELPEVAAKYADYVYLTEDDPANEDPMDICKQLSQKLIEKGTAFEIIIDRQTAVVTAIKKAQPKTVVLLLAKGSERYIRIGNEYVPYKSDSCIAKEMLE